MLFKLTALIFDALFPPRITQINAYNVLKYILNISL